jgi:hypothetical protein
VTIRYSFKSPHQPKIFCLTLGGHIPVPFITKELLLLDRNLLAKIKNQSKIRDKAELFWIGEFSRLSRNINPILTAYEGCLARQPTKEEFQNELISARKLLQEIYPSKNIIEHSTSLTASLFDALERKLQRKGEEVLFLEKTAHLVAHRPSDKELMPRLREIIALGRSAGLTSQSLAIIALLSCAAEKKDGSARSPGRAVIKPKLKVTNCEAYNAISDLQYLEFLIAAAANQQGTVVLCTTDRGLAEFWLALSPREVTRDENNDINFKLKVDKQLMPRLNNEQLEEIRTLI